MTPFEFFFSFYGLLLGLSVAALVGAVARLVQERRDVRFGVLTPLLGVFLVSDIATFWTQAWVVFRGAPLNYALLLLGLLIAGVYYVAATLVFPRDLKQWPSLDEHFWAHKRIVLLCVFTANLIVVSLTYGLSILRDELPPLSPVSLIFTSVFFVSTLVGALSRRKAVVVTALCLLLFGYAALVLRNVVALVESNGWPMMHGPL